MYYKVPLRFQKEIILHVLKNTQENLLLEGTASILGIFGPPGEGKTVMCKQVLDDLGVHIEKMSVSEFESKNAGEPVERLKQKYLNAQEKLLSTPTSKSVFIIDDADAALGNWGNMTQYTVNTQIIVGELMQIASNVKKRKVPIIIIGNDFSKIYYPLRRSGRMINFYWNPSKEERKDSVKMIFPWMSIEDCGKYIEDVERFAKKLKMKRPPISFYASVKNMMFDDDLWKQILEERKKTIGVSFISNLKIPNIYNLGYENLLEISKMELKNINNSNNSFVEGG